MTSWNAQFHERIDSTSTRTSSLTSVTHMYRRVPPVLKANQSCLAQPPPRYYDYTEDFEDKGPRLAPLDQTLAPLHSQIVILLPFLEKETRPFFDYDSQLVDGQGPLPVLTTIPSRSQSRAETPARSTSCRRPDSAPSQNSTIEFDASEIGGRNTRSSDIDLLPSQVGRDSIDTFNPSLDLESKDIPPSYKCVTYHSNTVPKTKTKSPERHVEILGGMAPTIRSEQGVILRDDTHCEITDRNPPEICQPLTEIGADELYPRNQIDGQLMADNDLTNHVHGTCAGSAQGEPQLNVPSPGTVERLPSRDELDLHESGAPPSPITTEGGPEPERPAEKPTEQKSENKPETGYSQQFRRHRRNHAVLRISTTNLPREDNEGHPHITPTCSTVPLVSPKPISPARQLKVKNSIPRLMKTLPPLPSTLGYDLPSTTTDFVEEDEFAEILVPFKFHGGKEQSDKRNSVDLGIAMGNGANPNTQKDGSKFKVKLKTTGCSESSDSLIHKSEKDTDEEIRHSGHLSDPVVSDELLAKHTRRRNRNKLKVRSPRRSRLSSSHSSTIRRNPVVEKPQIVMDIMCQKPQDLFSMPPKSETMLLRKRRRPLSQLAYPQGVTTFNASGSASLNEKANSKSYRVPSNVSTRDNELSTTGRDTIISSMPPHGLLKRLSNLRALLSSATSTPLVQGTESLRIHKASVNAFKNADFGINKSMRMTESRVTEASQLRFRQRIRARLSRWVRGAKNAVRRCAKKKHNQREPGGVGQE
ncbi:hypothetical protein GQX73_g9783 [Xylaria multiplex]|uniref:Uncharacterized protein n=1 Tax=Xylaria multiplex TaxID=323545 RepID=A0A7C8ML05_9PEZI|nr:hypothetical protein GQX73_g9783 [Xylaria multiplex]